MKVPPFAMATAAALVPGYRHALNAAIAEDAEWHSLRMVAKPESMDELTAEVERRWDEARVVHVSLPSLRPSKADVIRSVRDEVMAGLR